MNKKKPLKIPTLLGLFLIFFFLSIGILYWDNFSPPWGEAKSFDVYPQNVKVSNITDSSFVVSWITQKQTTGLVKIDNQYFYDVRDQDKIPKLYKVHYIELENLDQDNTSIIINSSGIDFPQESISLTKKIIEPLQILPINGELKTSENKSSQGSIFYLSIDNSSLWTIFLKNKTDWIVPLSFIRTSDGQNYYCQINDCKQDTKIKIEVIAEEGNSLIQGSLKNAKPLIQPVILGQNLNLEAIESTSYLPTPTLAPSDSKPEKKTVKGVNTIAKVEILSPKENDTLNFPKPFIRGLGVPNEEILITIESAFKQIGKTNVLEDGTWYWTPKVSLEAGKHLLTITTKNEKGEKITLQREFYILKSGESVLSESTASAIITTAPSPVQLVPSPTLIVTSYFPNPSPTIPKSGFFVPTLILSAGGVLFLLFGLKMF